MLPPNMPTNTPTHHMSSPKQSPRAARPQKTAPIPLNQQPALKTISSPTPSVGAASAANTGAAGAMPRQILPRLNKLSRAMRPQLSTRRPQSPRPGYIPNTPAKPTSRVQFLDSCLTPQTTCQSPQTASLQPCPTRPNLIHEIRQKHLKPSMPLSSQPSPLTSFKP